MNRNLMLAVIVVAVAAAGLLRVQAHEVGSAVPDLAPVGANLIEGLGNYSMPVTAKNRRCSAGSTRA